MGSLLAGVAHELNNPLAILSGQTQLLRETVDDATVKQRADKIGAAADRCVRIVRNFLALARQDFSSLVGNMPELQDAVRRGPGGDGSVG